MFIDQGLLPKKARERFWILDRILIKEGYSKEDIEKMSCEEYDFICELLATTKIESIPNAFKGGI